MFIVKVTDSLDRALKVLKNKVQKTGLIKELRDRTTYTKPSVKRRNVVKKAKYVEKKFGNKN